MSYPIGKIRIDRNCWDVDMEFRIPTSACRSTGERHVCGVQSQRQASGDLSARRFDRTVGRRHWQESAEF